jgi:hypothetical protein
MYELPSSLLGRKFARVEGLPSSDVELCDARHQLLLGWQVRVAQVRYGSSAVVFCREN